MITWVLVGVLAAGALVAAYFVVRRAFKNAVSVKYLEAANELGAERIERLEQAEEVDRARVRREFDAKADSVATADDAARLLADAFGDDTPAN